MTRSDIPYKIYLQTADIPDQEMKSFEIDGEEEGKDEELVKQEEIKDKTLETDPLKADPSKKEPLKVEPPKIDQTNTEEPKTHRRIYKRIGDMLDARIIDGSDDKLQDEVKS